MSWAPKTPRTPWGDPDLQGTWDYRTITPLERAREFGTREFYTEEEKKTHDFGSYTAEHYYDDMGRITQYRTDPDLCEILIQPVFDDNSLGPVLHVVCKPAEHWVERKRNPKLQKTQCRPTKTLCVST